MKKIVLFILLIWIYNVSFSQSISVLFKDKTSAIFNIATIDSITNNESSHSIWFNGLNKPLVYFNGDILDVYFYDNENKYCLFSDEESCIKQGFCFESGHFGVLMLDTIKNNGHYVILGNTLTSDNYITAYIDSLSLLRNIHDGKYLYELYYFENNISISVLDIYNDSLYHYNVDYSYFDTRVDVDNLNTRVSHLTDNNWFKILNMTNLILDLRNPEKYTMMCDYLSIQNNRFINTAGDIASIILSLKKLSLINLPLNLLSLMDKMGELVFYRGASVKNLDAKENTANSYSLSCYVEGFDNILIDDYSWLECTMEVYSDKNILRQTKIVKSGDILTFDFSDLEYNTLYRYKPRVYLSWYEYVGNSNISMSDFLMGANNNIYVTTTQVKCGQYLLGEEKFFKTGDSCECKVVDLGLSVKWATCNVGAESPEDYGEYYAYAEKTTKNKYSERNYLFFYYDYQFDGQYSYYESIPGVGADISGSVYDVVAEQWGEGWRMPTHKEMQELVDSCTWTWTTKEGVIGYKVTGPNGNSIFLPASGAKYTTTGSDVLVGKTYDYAGDLNKLTWYRSSVMSSKQLGNDGFGYTYGIKFKQDVYDCSDACMKYAGYVIRPVKDKEVVSGDK